MGDECVTKSFVPCSVTSLVCVSKSETDISIGFPSNQSRVRQFETGVICVLENFEGG